MATMARTIYVADDNSALRDGINRALQARGYMVRAASDGPELLSLLEEERPDLLLLDVMMPGMSGLEVLRRIRADRRWSDLPVLLVTAAAGAEVAGLDLAAMGATGASAASVDLNAAPPIGAPAVIPKPFRLAELLYQIELRLPSSA